MSDDEFHIETIRRRAGQIVTGPYRVLVTGSRGVTGTVVADTLDTIRGWLPPELDMVVVHGHCRDGADALADRWVAGHAGTPGPAVWHERHPAHWKPDGRDGPVNRRAGLDRNAGMVGRGADICVAFLMPCVKDGCRQKERHATHGSSDCAHKAKTARIPLWRIKVDWDG